MPGQRGRHRRRPAVLGRRARSGAPCASRDVPGRGTASRRPWPPCGARGASARAQEAPGLALRGGGRAARPPALPRGRRGGDARAAPRPRPATTWRPACAWCAATALWLTGPASRAARRAAARPRCRPRRRSRAHACWRRWRLFAWKTTGPRRAPSLICAQAEQIYAAADCPLGTRPRPGEARGHPARRGTAGGGAAPCRTVASRSRPASSRVRRAGPRPQRTAPACWPRSGRWEEARQEFDASAALFREKGDAREFTVAEAGAGGGRRGRRRSRPRAGRARARARPARGPRQHALPRGDAAARLRPAPRLRRSRTRPSASRWRPSACIGCSRTPKASAAAACAARTRLVDAAAASTEAVREGAGPRRAAARQPRRPRAPSRSSRSAAPCCASTAGEAGDVFERARDAGPGRPGYVEAADLGTGRRARRRPDAHEVRQALAGLEAWGDRRVLAYCPGRRARAPRPARRRPRRRARAGRAAAVPVLSAAVDAAAALVDGAGAGRALGGGDARPAARCCPGGAPRWSRSRAGSCARDLDRAGAAGAGATSRASWPRADRRARVVVDLGARRNGAATRRASARPRRRARGPAGRGRRCTSTSRSGRARPDERGLALLAAVRAPPGLLPLEPLRRRSPRSRRRRARDRRRSPGDARRSSATLARVAPSDLTVHVFGETGTGKERVAEALHARSPRARAASCAVNASSLGDELFESEMFGHVRGAFTGAVADREGYVAAAEGGTLFLDEVTDLSPRAQAKLLRFLEKREYRRVGETRLRAANVRLVTAANVPLESVRGLRPGPRVPAARRSSSRCRRCASAATDCGCWPATSCARGRAPPACRRRRWPPRAARAGRATLAGQRARAAARDPARGGAGRRADHPAASTCRDGAARRALRRRSRSLREAAVRPSSASTSRATLARTRRQPRAHRGRARASRARRWSRKIARLGYRLRERRARLRSRARRAGARTAPGTCGFLDEEADAEARGRGAEHGAAPSPSSTSSARRRLCEAVR